MCDTDIIRFFNIRFHLINPRIIKFDDLDVLQSVPGTT